MENNTRTSIPIWFAGIPLFTLFSWMCWHNRSNLIPTVDSTIIMWAWVLAGFSMILGAVWLFFLGFALRAQSETSRTRMLANLFAVFSGLCLTVAAVLVWVEAVR